ncbi:MAG: phage minor head protein [Novosphingobium sp.]
MSVTDFMRSLGRSRRQAAQAPVAESLRPVRARASVADFVEYFSIPTGDAFDVPPEEALAFFRSKGLQATFSWADMLGEAHDHAFTVAKMMDVDMLGQVHASMESAMANGVHFKEWADEITPILQAGGWWGRKEVVDPLTGKTIVAQLGSPARLETIFRTNMASAYAAGQWQEIEGQAGRAPYLLYDAVDDHRTRPEHRAWDGTVLPAYHSWWRTHYPPNGWGCRCGVIQLDAEEVEALGLKVSAKAPGGGTYRWRNPRTDSVVGVPNGLEPGFDHNSGVSYLRDLKRLLAEKIEQLPAELAEAARRGLAAGGGGAS